MEIEHLISQEVINVEALVLSQASTLDLSLEQLGFLLLFYRYTKQSAWLLPSSQQFAQTYNLDVADVKRLQNALFQGGYCEIESKTDQATLVEYVNWQLLYKRLQGDVIKPTSNQNSSAQVDIARLIEREFGRMLSPIEIELAGVWSRQYQYDDVVEAIKEAVLSDVKNMKYIDKILLNWSQGGRRTQTSIVPNQNQETEVQLDMYYNWLEDEGK